MMKIAFYQKLKTLIKQIGKRATFVFICHKLVKKLSRNNAIYYYLFYKMDIKQSAKLLQRKPTYSFTWLSEYNDKLSALPRPNAVILDRFNQGCKCLLAEKDGVFVGCIWLGFGTYIEDECRAKYSLSETSAWDFDVYVEPSQRLSRLFIYMWSQVLTDLEAQGYENCYSRISAFNQASITTHSRLGGKEVGRSIISALQSSELAISNFKPHFHFSTKDKSKVEFKF